MSATIKRLRDENKYLTQEIAERQHRLTVLNGEHTEVHRQILFYANSH